MSRADGAANAWRTRTAVAGTKGDRRHSWARTRISGPAESGEHWLLARRSLKDPADLACYICHGQKRVPPAELVRITGARWAIEETFQTSKGETGLDHYQVRQYAGRTAGHERLARVCRHALERARTVLAAAGLTENIPI